MESNDERQAVSSPCSKTGRWIATWSIGTDRAKSKIKGRRSEFGVSNHGPGWKVAWQSDDNLWLVPLVFARQVDAERAAETVRNICDWGDTVEEIADQVLSIGLGEFRRLMVRDLFW